MAYLGVNSSCSGGAWPRYAKDNRQLTLVHMWLVHMQHQLAIHLQLDFHDGTRDGWQTLPATVLG